MVEREPDRNDPVRRGSALAMVVVTAGVLFLLVGIVYVYFTSNARTAVHRMNGIRADMAAEAGVALALHHLSTLDVLPRNTDPFVLLVDDEGVEWTEVGNTGSTMAVIDPVNGITGGLGNGAVEIRSIGAAGAESVMVKARAAPMYPSSYALLTQDGIPQGFFVDGRVVDGPVHSNGPIYFSSYSPDSTDDPYVEMISTTSDGGFYFSGHGRQEVPHPEGSNVWVRPYPRLRSGAPHWRTTAPPVDFQRIADHFREVASHSPDATTAVISAQRMILEGQRIAYKTSMNGVEQYLNLNDIDLVIARNGFSPVMLKSSSIPDHPLTILSPGNLMIYGSIQGGAVGSGGPLGLVTLGDFIISADPDLSGGDDWSGRWDIETDGGLLVRACMVAPEGCLRAEIPYLPSNQTRLTIVGSLMEGSMGRLSSGSSGYQLGVSWDRGLISLHPPHFPTLGRWNVFSWMEDQGGETGGILNDSV